MIRNINKTLVCALLIVGCGPKDGASETDASSGTAAQTDTGEPTPTTGTTVATDTNDTTAVTAASEPTSSTGPGTEATAGETGAPVDCSLSACMTVVQYDCEAEIGGPCDDPCPGLAPANCGGEELCGQVVVKSSQDNTAEYSEVESEANAICVLEALRDRKPGRVRVTWGDTQGFDGDSSMAIDATVEILGDDTVLMAWDWDWRTCCIETYGRSQRVQLQPAEFFTECLTAPDTASLIACFTAGSTSVDPAPDGWLPPWTTGTCDTTLPAVCP